MKETNIQNASSELNEELDVKQLIEELESTGITTENIQKCADIIARVCEVICEVICEILHRAAEFLSAQFELYELQYEHIADIAKEKYPRIYHLAYYGKTERTKRKNLKRLYDLIKALYRPGI